MKKLFTSIALLTTLLAANAQSGEMVGHAACENTLNHTPCVLDWSFPDSVKGKLVLEKWDRTSAEWVKQASLRATAKRPIALPPGALYRVSICSSKGRGCKSSNAIWSPVWADPKDIPDYVEIERDGATSRHEIDRDDGRGNAWGPAFQVTQYNMYLLDRELAGIFNTVEYMPPMLLPEMKNEAPVSLEEQVVFNVFDIYEATRLELEAYRKTGNVRM